MRSPNILAILLMSFLSPIASADVVRLCVEHWPPYTVVKDGKVIGGSSVELAKEALKRIGNMLEVDYVPWRRCLEMVKSGERDAVADASASQREEFKMVTGTHMTSLWSLAIWVRESDQEKEFKSLEHYRGKTVGMVKDYDYPDAIKKFDGWKKDIAINDKLNLTKLANGRFDVAVSDIVNTMAVARENNLKVRYLAPPVVSDPLYIAFTAKKTDLAKKFDESLGGLIKDGTADTIYEKAVGGKYSVLTKQGK